MNAEEALSILCDDSLDGSALLPMDLTRQDFQERLKRLRRLDKAKAHQVERALWHRFYDLYNLRRHRKWQGTALGTRARLRLLPDNPHLAADVALAREALGLADGLFEEALEKHPVWAEAKGGLPDENVSQLAEMIVVGAWLDLHRSTAAGKAAPEEDVDRWLTPGLRDAAVASASVDLGASGVAPWLQQPREEAATGQSLGSPFDRVVDRLMERHRLSRQARPAIVRYLLSGRAKWTWKLGGKLPFEVAFQEGRSPTRDPMAFTIVIEGVDESMTKEDWDQIWEEKVRPQQRARWVLRGMGSDEALPRVDMEQLEQVMPLYQTLVEENLSVERLLDHAQIDLDHEDIRSVLRELRALLSPAP